MTAETGNCSHDPRLNHRRDGSCTVPICPDYRAVEPRPRPGPADCWCDGRYTGCGHEGVCSTPPGGRWSPYFCPDCDKRRVEHIGRNLRDIRRSMS